MMKFSTPIFFTLISSFRNEPRGAAAQNLRHPVPSRLRFVGDPPAHPLGVCEGDCDDDHDCAGNLRCFHRRWNWQGVPGCAFGGYDGSYDYWTDAWSDHWTYDPHWTDYCYDPQQQQPQQQQSQQQQAQQQQSQQQQSQQQQLQQQQSQQQQLQQLQPQQPQQQQPQQQQQQQPQQQQPQQQQPQYFAYGSVIAKAPTGAPARTHYVAPATQHFAYDTMRQMRYFRLKMYWKRGYYWQESSSERRYCAEAKRPELGSVVEIMRCSDEYPEQRWRFYRSSRFLLESAYAPGLCMGLHGSRIKLDPCDGGDGRQHWDLKGTSDLKFEWHPLGRSDRCVSNEHHPTSYEDLKVMSCDKADRDETNYWTIYD